MMNSKCCCLQCDLVVRRSKVVEEGLQMPSFNSGGVAFGTCRFQRWRCTGIMAFQRLIVPLWFADAVSVCLQEYAEATYGKEVRPGVDTDISFVSIKRYSEFQ